MIRLTIVLACLLLHTPFVWAQVAPPSHEEIERIFNQHYAQRLLFYKPMDLPQEVERSHKALVRQLDQWVEFGLLSRKKTRFLAEKEMYGYLREVSVGGYLYDLNRDSALVSDKGFYYGRPMLKEVFSVSEPTHINANYYCEVYLSWYAASRPEWLSKLDTSPRPLRLLRRAKESERKPFEKRIHLIYQDDRWQLWLDKGDQPLF